MMEMLGTIMSNGKFSKGLRDGSLMRLTWIFYSDERSILKKTAAIMADIGSSDCEDAAWKESGDAPAPI